MPVQLPPPPLQSPLIELPVVTRQDQVLRAKDLTGLITRAWNQYFLTFSDRVDQAPQAVHTTTVPATGAAIGATPIPLGTVGAGLFRVNWYLTITRAATTSSSVQVTITHTDHGVTKSQSGAAVTSNVTTAVQSGIVLCRIDQATAITYAVAYSTSGATTMQYELVIVVEQIG